MSEPLALEVGKMGKPSALGGDFRRFVFLTFTLAVTEFKLRFFGSVLGYLWQLMRPLLLFTVLYVVFTQAIKVGAQVKDFPVVLLTNIIIYTFFAEATGGSVTSVVDNEQLVRKIRFPRLAVPMSTVLTAMFNLGLNLIVLAIFVFASGVQPRLSWLLVPVLLLPVVALAAGFATLLSALYVRYRDMRPIWEVSLQVILYATPIIYTVEIIDSERVRQLFMLNPLAVVLEEIRFAMIDPAAPTALDVAGGWAILSIPLILIVAIPLIGFVTFNRLAPKMAEDL